VNVEFLFLQFSSRFDTFLFDIDTYAGGALKRAFDAGTITLPNFSSLVKLFAFSPQISFVQDYADGFDHLMKSICPS
jgi:hypothetical protein